MSVGASPPGQSNLNDQAIDFLDEIVTCFAIVDNHSIQPDPLVLFLMIVRDWLRGTEDKLVDLTTKDFRFELRSFDCEFSSLQILCECLKGKIFWKICEL